MSFTQKIKEEIVNSDIDLNETKYLLTAFIKYGNKSSNNITLVLENPLIARKIYSFINDIFQTKAGITIRIQKRFKTKRIYILTINNNVEKICQKCNIEMKNNVLKNDIFDLKTLTEKKSYLKGTFLTCGSVSDPNSGGYHFELVFNAKKDADFISNLLKEFNVNAKILKRTKKYMVYIKVSEEISDILKILDANTALFYFEDIRTKKDHINMVNRINNCEQANQDKTIQTGMKQIDDIRYLKENDLITLLDEKTQIVMNYREKYPELSYQELSEVVSLESGYKITKSGINHHFIKMRELVNRHKKKSMTK
ncbi:MAG: DNA-binding protein WhiA [Bacilli bacterium]|nr:DNA-binding protein WhiA [Bacilli bacterium]